MPMRPRTLLLAAALAAATPMARVHAQAADAAADAAARAVASWIVVDAPPGSEGRPSLNKVFSGWTVDAWGNYSKRVGSGRPRRVDRLPVRVQRKRDRGTGRLQFLVVERREAVGDVERHETDPKITQQ